MTMIVTPIAPSVNLKTMMSHLTISKKKTNLPSTASKKKVSFATSARARLCLHVNDYTDEEHMACWNSKPERRSIKENLYKTTVWMELGRMSQIPGSDTVERSINKLTAEPLTPTGRRRAFKIRKLARDAVLVEQRSQRRSGKFVYDDLEISNKYKEISDRSQLNANKRAFRLRSLGQQ